MGQSCFGKIPLEVYITPFRFQVQTKLCIIKMSLSKTWSIVMILVKKRFIAFYTSTVTFKLIMMLIINPQIVSLVPRSGQSKLKKAKKAGGGGSTRIIFDRVWGASWFLKPPFFEIFANRDPFLRIFLAQKRLILNFCSQFWWNGTLLLGFFFDY